MEPALLQSLRPDSVSAPVKVQHLDVGPIPVVAEVAVSQSPLGAEVPLGRITGFVFRQQARPLIRWNFTRQADD